MVPAQTTHKPIQTSSAKQTTCTKRLLSKCIYCWMSDKNDKASSKPIPPGKQAYWLINCFAEGKLNYYGKAAKYLKISEKKPQNVMRWLWRVTFYKSTFTNLNEFTDMGKLEIRATMIIVSKIKKNSYIISKILIGIISKLLIGIISRILIGILEEFLPLNCIALMVMKFLQFLFNSTATYLYSTDKISTGEVVEYQKFCHRSRCYQNFSRFQSEFRKQLASLYQIPTWAVWNALWRAINVVS